MTEIMAITNLTKFHYELLSATFDDQMSVYRHIWQLPDNPVPYPVSL